MEWNCLASLNWCDWIEEKLEKENFDVQDSSLLMSDPNSSRIDCNLKQDLPQYYLDSQIEVSLKRVLP